MSVPAGTNQSVIQTHIYVFWYTNRILWVVIIAEFLSIRSSLFVDSELTKRRFATLTSGL